MTTTNTTTSETTTFKPQEVAFQKLTMKGAGQWQRRIIKTQKAWDKFVQKMEDGDFNWECRDAEGF
jgi:hypothetical protein